MANMSYCRFENTFADFKDCLRALQRGELSNEYDHPYRARLYEAAKEYIEEYELRKAQGKEDKFIKL